VAAAGSAATDATALTTGKNFVTASDGAKGVILPVAELDMSVTVVNTVAGSSLLVYPNTGAQINALTATTGAFTVPGSNEATFHCDASLHWYVAGGGTEAFDNLTMANPINYDHNTTITAFATGGQASATALTGEFNNVTTVATAGDSVKLPTAAAGLSITVKNSGVADLAVFPASSDSINALAVNLSVTIPVSGMITFKAINATVWETQEILRADGLDMSSGVPVSHAINLEGLTLPSNTNAIRGASVNPTRTSGWVSFSGTIDATPAQCYTDYRELHTTGVAEVLGIGSFPYMDATASCASMFGGQDIAFVSAGATILSAAAAPGTGVFARWMKTTLDGETFTSGGCAAVNFKSFQANVTSVGGEETSIDDIEIASGQIGSIWRIRKTAGAIARSLIYFDSATVAPIIQDPTLFTDPNAATCEKGLHVRIGNVSYMIPLYVSDSGGVVADW
jgi:hypothetical protein